MLEAPCQSISLAAPSMGEGGFLGLEAESGRLMAYSVRGSKEMEKEKGKEKEQNVQYSFTWG